MRVPALLDWLVQPFDTERPGAWRARAGRVFGVAGVLACGIVPLLMLAHGADGWLWSLTTAVLVTTPLGILGFDALGMALLRGRRSAGALLARMALLQAGIAVGMGAGYGVAVALALEPLPPSAVLVADYARNLEVITLVVLAATGAALAVWTRAARFEAEALATEARLSSLEAQLRPHFLFNALSSLKELVETEPARAKDMAQSLADLYRAILDASARPTIPLAEELALVRAYLDVEATRYGARLDARVAPLDASLARVGVPPLLVQTLAENGIKHGVTKSRAGGPVHVRASALADGRVEIVVENGGAPYAPAGEGGRGLANARARLLAVFGDAAQLELGPAEDRALTRARVVLPRGVAS